MRLARTLLLLSLAAPCSLRAIAPDRAARAAAPLPEIRFTETFDDARLLDRSWYDGSRFKISAAEAHAGKGSIEYHWTPGATIPESTSALRRLFAPTDRVYLRFYMKLSPGWRWTGRDYHPHLIQFLTTENDKFRGPAASHLTLYVEPQEGKLRLAAQDIQNQGAPHGLTQGPLRGGYNGRLYDSPGVVFRDDRWHCVEAAFKLNSLDLKQDRPVADGEARGWVDGNLVIDRKELVFRSTDFPAMQINQLLVAPYFGPGLLPHEQSLWIDDLTVGTSRTDPAPG